jgi:hypothetical protein
MSESDQSTTQDQLPESGFRIPMPPVKPPKAAAPDLKSVAGKMRAGAAMALLGEPGKTIVEHELEGWADAVEGHVCESEEFVGELSEAPKASEARPARAPLGPDASICANCRWHSPRRVFGLYYWPDARRADSLNPEHACADPSAQAPAEIDPVTGRNHAPPVVCEERNPGGSCDGFEVAPARDEPREQRGAVRELVRAFGNLLVRWTF